MAVQGVTSSRSFAIEVRTSTDALGNPVYSKKSFSNVSIDATLENVYEVANEVKDLLKGDTRDVYLSQTDQLINV